MEFKTYKIKDIGTVQGGGTPSTKIKEYYGGEIPWITPKDLSSYNNVYISRGERNITLDGLENSSAKLLPKNTVLMTSRAPIGYLAIARNELSTNQGFKSIICNESIIRPRYLYYLLKNEMKRIKALGTGSTFSEISGTVVKNIEITIPNLIHQKRIELFLSAIDERIENNNNTIANLEELSQTIFKRWFIDFEFPDENGNPYKSSGGEFKIVEGEAIPRTWKKEKLGNIITITSGKRPITKSNVKNSKYKYPIIGASKVMGFTNEYKYEDRRFIIGRVGTHGIIQEFNERIWPSDNTFVIKTEYWNYVKNILLDIDYNALNRGSTQPLITQTDLKNTQILVPDNLNKISDFEKFFEAQSSKIFTLKKEITYLESLRNTLLPKLMSGEIELPEDLEV